MKRVLLLGLILLGWSVTVSGAPQAEHVVLISLDGLRPDAIEESGAVTLTILIKDGTYCPKAKTVRPSLTVPAHASMLTGLDVSRHGANWNDYKPGEISSPTLFSLVKKSGGGAMAFCSKPKLYPMLPKESLELRYLPPIPENWDSADSKLVRAGGRKSYAGPPDTTAPGIVKVFADKWPKRKPAFAFVHFRETDVAGHKHDWMSDEYLEAVRVCDRAVGSILEILEKSGARSKTAVIVTSDHGGDGGHHLDDIPENNTIPWICAGPGVPKGLKIDREVSIKDTTPTILQLLGVPVPKKLDGKLVEEVVLR